MNQVDLAETLKQVEVDIGKIDFTGLSPDEVAARLSDVFSTALSGVVDSVDEFDILIGRYAQNAEYSLETLVRIATEYDQASFSFDLIGKKFIDGVLGFTAQMQALDIVASTGGLTEFQDAMDSFMSNFYTDVEQVEFLTRSINQSFATLGISAPKTNDEFRTLLETMDTSTEEVAYLYVHVLLLSDGFAEMTKASETLVDSMGNSVSAIADLYLGSLSYLNLQEKADYASRYFEIARQPDSGLDALEAATAAAETALRTSRTREDYIPVFEALVQEQRKKVEDATNQDLLEGIDDMKEEVVGKLSDLIRRSS